MTITRKEYDFSGAVKNPYAKKQRRQITINTDEEVIAWFRQQAQSSGIPYQTLMNLYLADCAANKRELHLSWQ